jgi:hypothetical protein
LTTEIGDPNASDTILLGCFLFSDDVGLQKQINRELRFTCTHRLIKTTCAMQILNLCPVQRESTTRELLVLPTALLIQRVSAMTD